MPGPKKQIVSLGAGYDTRYFALKAGILGDTLADSLSCYFEIDFDEVTTKKAMIIKRQAELSKHLLDVKMERGGMDLKSQDYCLLGGDLRHWPEVSNRLIRAGFDSNAPTLFLSECVFIYLSSQDSDTILQWITDHTANTMFALYEQIRPDDPFGKMMLKNLKGRNIDLKGIHAFPDLEHQRARFKGWQHAEAVDINTVHDKCLSREELARITKLEMLDELEEWHMLSAHYCIAWAYKTKDFEQQFSKVMLKQ